MLKTVYRVNALRTDMRIVKDSDLHGLGEHAKKQIQAALNRNDKASVEKQQKGASRTPKVNKSKLLDSKSKVSSRIQTDPVSHLKYCPYPSTDPAVWLHIALEKRFGNYWSGGDLVTEMIIPGHETKFRYDFAILSAKLLVEFDGWAFHSRKEAFKRDRAKHRHALLKGWVTLPITNAMVRDDLDSIVNDIETLIRIRPQYDVPTIKMKGRTQCVYPY